RRAGALPTTDARDVAIAWPWAAIADGAAGLVLADVSDAAEPRCLATVDLNGGDAVPNEAFDVELFFQFSRTSAADQDGGRLARSRARHLAFVACGLDGVRIVDVTEPQQPVVLHGATARRTFRFGRGDVRGVAVNTVFELGSEGGGLKSAERDYLYVAYDDGPDEARRQHVRVFDVSDPLAPAAVPRANPRVYGGT